MTDAKEKRTKALEMALSSRNCSFIIMLLLSFLLISCANSPEGTDQEQGIASGATISFLGNGARETTNYYFKDREVSSVRIYFYDPFLSPPNVRKTSGILDYDITEVSNWGFSISIPNAGFWKDTTFNVTGTPANGTDFCYEFDNGIDRFSGSKIYTLEGMHEDTC